MDNRKMDFKITNNTFEVIFHFATKTNSFVLSVED